MLPAANNPIVQGLFANYFLKAMVAGVVFKLMENNCTQKKIICFFFESIHINLSNRNLEKKNISKSKRN